MIINKLVADLRESWSSPRSSDSNAEPADGGLLVCRFPPPEPWNRLEFETSKHLTLPEDLVTLWSLANGATFFEDVEFAQWGLVIWSPQATLQPDSLLIDLYRDKLEAGDLPIGRFLGDLDLVLLRCDPGVSDFGSVVIAISDYPRADWFRPAGSLGEFLERFARSPEAKYWES